MPGRPETSVAIPRSTAPKWSAAGRLQRLIGTRRPRVAVRDVGTAAAADADAGSGSYAAERLDDAAAAAAAAVRRRSEAAAGDVEQSGDVVDRTGRRAP